MNSPDNLTSYGAADTFRAWDFEVWKHANVLICDILPTRSIIITDNLSSDEQEYWDRTKRSVEASLNIFHTIDGTSVLGRSSRAVAAYCLNKGWMLNPTVSINEVVGFAIANIYAIALRFPKLTVGEVAYAISLDRAGMSASMDVTPPLDDTSSPISLSIAGIPRRSIMQVWWNTAPAIHIFSRISEMNKKYKAHDLNRYSALVWTHYAMFPIMFAANLHLTSETGKTAGGNLSQLEDSVIESRLQTEVLPLQQYTFSAISDYYCHGIYRTAQVASCIENGIAADLMGSVRV